MEEQDLRRQMEALLRERPDIAPRLLALRGGIDDLDRGIRKIEAALEAGRQARSALRNAMKRLGGIHDWKTGDSGSLMASILASHENIDDTRAAIKIAREKLSLLRAQLREIGDLDEVHADLSGFRGTSDASDERIANLLERGRAGKARILAEELLGLTGMPHRALEALKSREEEKRRAVLAMLREIIEGV